MRLCGICRAGARWPATIRAAAPPWRTLAGWRRKPEGPSGLSCSTWLRTVTTASSASSAAPHRNGTHLDVSNCIVFEHKDGKVTDGREHFEDLYAWDEFWS